MGQETSMRSKHGMNHPPRQLLRRAAIDALEPRRMLAVFNATAGNDTIDIFRTAFPVAVTHVVINGTDQATTDSTVTVNAGDGHDVISVASTRSGSNVTVNGSGGDDLLQNTVNDLDAVYAGNFVFVGGGGFDRIAADNGADTTDAGSFRIQNDRIVKELNNLPDDTLLNFSQVDALDYADNDFGNRIGFVNLLSADFNVANVTIRGHGGNDTITNTASTTPDSGSWPTSIGTGGLRVEAGPGTDTLVLKTTSDAGGTYTLRATTIEVDSPHNSSGPLTYLGCETVTFLSSPQRDVVDILSKPL